MEMDHLKTEAVESLIKSLQEELCKRRDQTLKQASPERLAESNHQYETTGASSVNQAGKRAYPESPQSRQYGDYKWAMIQMAHGLPVRRQHWPSDHHCRLANMQSPLYEAILVRKAWEGYQGWSPFLNDLVADDWIVATV